MKREIRFRGKPIEGRLPNGEVLTGDFVYGNLIITNTEYHILSLVGNVFKNYNVVPATVGQLTGLHDANGKEIYEGDIVRTSISESSIGTVRWGDEQAAFIVQMNGSYQWYSLSRTYKIIGNIHDNPDLLKGGNQ